MHMHVFFLPLHPSLARSLPPSLTLFLPPPRMSINGVACVRTRFVSRYRKKYSVSKNALCIPRHSVFFSIEECTEHSSTQSVFFYISMIFFLFVSVCIIWHGVRSLYFHDCFFCLLACALFDMECVLYISMIVFLFVSFCIPWHGVCSLYSLPPSLPPVLLPSVRRIDRHRHHSLY
jgi:hypothetical protein